LFNEAFVVDSIAARQPDLRVALPSVRITAATTNQEIRNLRS
jgi:hypothetical protein